MAIARITSKGQITVPREVRERLDVKPGDALEFVLDEHGQRAEVRPVRRPSIAEFRGLFKVRGVPDEPFDWVAQRRHAWDAQTSHLAPHSDKDD